MVVRKLPGLPRKAAVAFKVSFALLLVLAGRFLFAQPTGNLKLRENALDEYRKGHYSEAAIWIRTALESDRAARDERALALDYSTLGDICLGQEQFTEAEQAYETAVQIFSRQPGQSHALAIVLRNLGSLLSARGRFHDAVATLNQASKLTRKHKFDDLPLTAEIFNSLGVVYFHEGEMRKAETSFVQATVIDAPSNNALDVAWNNLGSLYEKRGEYSKAEAAYTKALRITETRLGESHSNVGVTLASLGVLYNTTGRYKEAEPIFERSIRILEKAMLSDGKLMLDALNGLAKTYIGEHDERRAEPLLARAIGIARLRAAEPANAPTVIAVMETYSRVLRDLQKPVEADRVQADARRLRASITYTIQASRAK